MRRRLAAGFATAIAGLAMLAGLSAGAAGDARAGEQQPPAPAEVASRNPVAAAERDLALRAEGLQLAEAKPGSTVRRKTHSVGAQRVQLTGDMKGTSFLLDLTGGVPAEVFTLADPYRVVIDLPHVNFRLPDGIGQKGQGLVSAFRYGLLSEGKARIVLDTVKPVLISKADMKALAGKAVRLSIELTPTTAKTFGAGTGPRKAAARKAAEDEIVPPKKPKNRGKPVIVIDAGHGGVDPGAISPSNLPEKKVVLAVARKLRSRLGKDNRYDVHMTRTRDVFISLDERLEISRKLDADLFISLHADAIAQKNFANRVRGATVYTLSERASDEAARLMAEKENASDLIAGLSASEEAGQDQVRSILFDLLKRETSNFSADFSNTLVKGLKKTVSLSRDPQRSAAFKVLRQADTPSVLVELGYMSHKEDEKLLNSPAWQTKVADAIGSAVDSYFAKRTARAP